MIYSSKSWNLIQSASFDPPLAAKPESDEGAEGRIKDLKAVCLWLVLFAFLP
jgi:hypothetical protein